MSRNRSVNGIICYIKSFFDDKANGERLYLIALTMYLLAGFSDTTMFDRWLILVKIFKYSPLIFLFIKFVFFDKYTLKEFFIKVFILLVGSVVMFKAGSEGNRAMYCCYFLATARGVNFEKILKCFVVVSIGYILITLFAYRFDLVENIIFHPVRNDKIVRRESLGFIYPTDAAAHFLYLTMAFFYLMRDRMKWYWCILGVAFQIPVFLLTYTRATMYGMIIFCLGFLVLNGYEKTRERGMRKKYCESVTPVFFRWIMPVCAVFMTVLTMLYDGENPVMFKLNRWLSTRLSLGKSGIENYGVSLLGNNVEFIGGGGTAIRPDNYNFVDCSYLYSAIKYGIIFLIILIGAYVYACYRYKDDVYYIFCVTVISIHAMVEHHLMDPVYVVFFLAATSVRNITPMDHNLTKGILLSE